MTTLDYAAERAACCAFLQQAQDKARELGDLIVLARQHAITNHNHFSALAANAQDQLEQLQDLEARLP